MAKEPSTSKTKVRVVGYLDGILSTALVFKIICCTIYPLIRGEETIRDDDEISFDSQLTPHQSGAGDSNKLLRWSFLVACILVGIIPILAAAALVMSTRTNVGQERAIEMTRFWMHSNVFTIVAATLEFITACVIYSYGYSVGIPIPTLLYLCWRGIFTLIIHNQLEAMNPTLNAATLSNNLTGETQEERKKYVQISPIIAVNVSNSMKVYPPSMSLRPYRGRGMSMPNCQCVAPQNV